MKKVNLIIIRSYDEEYEDNFANRVAEEVKKVVAKNNVNFCNDEIEIEVNLIKEGI